MIIMPILFSTYAAGRPYARGMGQCGLGNANRVFTRYMAASPPQSFIENS